MGEATRGARIGDAAAAKAFMLAGRARVTLVSQRTGTRFTFRVTQHDRDPKIWFVAVLTGPSNAEDYQFLGTIFGKSWGQPEEYIRGTKSRIARDAPSGLAFSWVWVRLAKGEMPAEVEVWHEGRCGKCGRVLTVPESIASGIGPKCEGRAKPNVEDDERAMQRMEAAGDREQTSREEQAKVAIREAVEARSAA
jgi:hypothetical protein